ncbi:lipopolysaccharide assembly protein LapA domain-containing protein [Desulfocurvus vexinensis]|uniref:lipopolysaccharide assembly protein LapA domain-containing protein n=1 Tax=Desulfocurvus vexinensis TaxID=399548 RepID=UPI0004AD5C42|nr:LapA family protein [Desulfocurvus vexinensis]
MRFIKFLAVIALFVLTMALFAQNLPVLGAPLSLGLTLFDAQLFALESPLYMFLLAAFFLGSVLTLLYFFLEKLRTGRELARANRKLATLEQEVTSLRNLPLSDATPAQDN